MAQGLERGEHYVLRVGKSYYAGMEPVKVTREVRVPKVIKGKPKNPKYMSNAINRKKSWWTPSSTTETVTKEELTGKFVDRWVSQIEDAKPFRLHRKALEKAKKITSELGLASVKVHIEVYRSNEK